MPGLHDESFERFIGFSVEQFTLCMNEFVQSYVLSICLPCGTKQRDEGQSSHCCCFAIQYGNLQYGTMYNSWILPNILLHNRLASLLFCLYSMTFWAFAVVKKRGRCTQASPTPQCCATPINFPLFHPKTCSWVKQRAISCCANNLLWPLKVRRTECK